MTSLMKIGNFFIRFILSSPFHKLMSSTTLVIEFTGRKSGRRLRTPVNYTQEGSTVRITSQKDRVWWRNLKTYPAVSLWLQGEQVHGDAVVFENPVDVAKHFTAFLQPAPQMSRYFNVEVMANGSFNPEDLERAVQNMVVVEITID